MDDLSTLDWSSTTTTGKGKEKGNGITTNASALPPRSMNPPSVYPTLRPTPSPQASARHTPLSTQGSGFAAPKPAVDSFSNLVSFGTSKNNANLSLRERQQQLEAEKRQKEEEQRKQLQSQYGGGQFWDSLAQGSSAASRTVSPAAPSIGGTSIGTGIGASATPNKDDDDDLFAAFNKDTVVDTSSHFPRPTQPASGTGTLAGAAQLNLRNANAWSQPAGGLGDDDDDPFGLNQLKPRAQPQPQSSAATDGDDDILGDLGKPVDQVRRQAPPQPKAEPGKPIEDSDSDSSSEPEALPRDGGSDPFDMAVAELIDMGFSKENARRGLTESGAGLNIQAAVGWLLDDAHKQARSKQTPRDSPAEHSRRQENSRSRNNGSPAWMNEGQTNSTPRRGESSSPAYGDELSKKAAAMGNSFFKTANSLWKTGQKQVQKAVADLQLDDRDPSQPKWMQSAQQDRPYPSEKQSQSATDEAMMLEAGARPERHSSRSSQTRAGSSRDQSPALPTRPSAQASRAPKWQQPAPPADPRARLNKQAIEEQSAQAYVSPARRKKAMPQPSQQATPEPDLLNASAPVPSQPKPTRSAQQPPIAPKPSSQPTSRTITPRPPPPSRNIPPVSSSILQASTKHRLEGTAQFKRGDYDSAHTSYTNSLAGIPQSHPLCVVLLANRALTALKTGSPKQAVTDANAAIGIIGPSRGEGEKVAVADGEQRDMKDLYGKVLSRKAEALEQMEKWSEAGDVWQQCVEAGVGGPNAITGRQRCQKAVAPKPKATPRPVQAAKPRPKPSAIADLGPQKSSEAVQRLKEANKAAEAADEEKFALSEKVDARIAAWRDGKRENLRALIGSLDQVLWEGSGWKKVGLHELVMANKVKIHYMKAIAKCHPDKLPQDANTEVRLIAATVFATLNESWDKFKADNGL